MSDRYLDRWAAWLLYRRHGGDPQEHRRTLDRLAQVRDRVLDNAGLKDGETLLDVGTGDGLIAFGALARVGDHGRVVFSDVSRDLLNHDRSLVEEMGLADRCSFVEASADDLAPIADESVDVVTTRSVLAYVKGKERAFAEFARVLRPGGRISLYEPINRFFYPEPPHLFFGYNVSPVLDLATKIKVFGDGPQVSADDPMLDFDDRDLLAHAERVGFTERHVELRADATTHQPQHWTTFLHSAPNPLAPTLAEALAEALTDEEAKRFTDHLRPLVESGQGTFSVAVAFLWATRPTHLH